MKNGLRTVIIICSISVLAGIVCIVAGYSMGGKLSFNIDVKNHTVETSGYDTIKGSQELKEFSELEVNSDVADITVIADGDQYSVEYSVSGSEPLIELTDGKLKIKEKNRHIFFIGFGISMKNSYITVHVPKDADMEKIKLKSDTGKINVDNINAENKENGYIGNIDINSDTGKVSFNNVAVSTLKIKTDTGNCVIDHLNANEVDTKSDTGNVTITNADMDSFTGDADTGNIKLAQVSVNKVSAKADTGNVECDIHGTEKDYGMHLKTDVGSIRINGDKKGTDYTKETAESKRIDITTDTGNIKVDFN